MGLEMVNENSKKMSEKMDLVEGEQVKSDQTLKTLHDSFAALNVGRPRTSPTKNRNRTRTSSEPPLPPQKYTREHRKFFEKQLSKCRRIGVLHGHLDEEVTLMRGCFNNLDESLLGACRAMVRGMKKFGSNKDPERAAQVMFKQLRPMVEYA